MLINSKVTWFIINEINVKGLILFCFALLVGLFGGGGDDLEEEEGVEEGGGSVSEQEDRVFDFGEGGVETSQGSRHNQKQGNDA